MPTGCWCPGSARLKTHQLDGGNHHVAQPSENVAKEKAAVWMDVTATATITSHLQMSQVCKFFQLDTVSNCYVSKREMAVFILQIVFGLENKEQTGDFEIKRLKLTIK